MEEINPAAAKEQDREPASAMRGGFFEEVREIVRVLLISLAIVAPIRYFVVQPFVVRGASMEPNFTDREYLVIDEATYYFRLPLRGEVVVFRYPRDTSQFFIKRIIGLPGETVSIDRGQVHIKNAEYPEGFTLPEPYLESTLRTRPDMSMVLRDDEYFLLGDNRSGSSDSRYWGALKRSLIVGKAVFSAWPPEKIGLLPGRPAGY